MTKSNQELKTSTVLFTLFCFILFTIVLLSLIYINNKETLSERCKDQNKNKD